jgi:hypothetical protein
MKHLLDIAGFLEHDIAWARCICSDLKIRASIQLIFFADYIIANTYFFELLFMIGSVPAPTISSDHKRFGCHKES